MSNYARQSDRKEMSMVESLWTNAEAQLFWSTQDLDPVWLRYVEIEKLRWNDPKKARLVLRGMLPLARQLLRIADGDILELLWAECGPPGDYRTEDIVMRFSGCTIKRKWIPSLAVIDTRDLYQPVTVYVSLECELRIDI
jgi:hypothetical protein